MRFLNNHIIINIITKLFIYLCSQKPSHNISKPNQMFTKQNSELNIQQYYIDVNVNMDNTV